MHLKLPLQEIYNGVGILSAIGENIRLKLKKSLPEATEELQNSIQRLDELNITRTNCYLYMQGHSVFNLVNRIGKALMDESFGHQVLMPSFSVNVEYLELDRIKADLRSVIR